ncbi:MAG TPA: tetratricopeptide repeat protein, partial [Polyangiales bacterium]
APAPAPAPAVVPLPARARTRDLLREANTLRARGNYARAERVYASIARSAAEPGEVEAATIAAAELRLEKLGDPHGALVLFRSALARRPESALSEEARFGLARCQRALGDGDAEASALRVFLADHPGSVLAPRARARLQALQTAAP